MAAEEAGRPGRWFQGKEATNRSNTKLSGTTVKKEGFSDASRKG